MAGESNSGGLAANTYASQQELSARRIKILNNTTYASFDSLHIGVNNLIGHVGLNYAEDSAQGWELEIANLYDQNVFTNRTVYLCKRGQGGTLVSQWFRGATYTAEAQTVEPYDTALAGIRAAYNLITAIHNRPPQVVILWSDFVNDAGAGTSTATFKANTKTVFQQFRDDLGYGDFPIIMTQGQSITPVYDAKMVEITNEMSNVYVINTTGAETTQVFAGAGSHWGYTGMKQIALAMVTLMLTVL